VFNPVLLEIIVVNCSPVSHVDTMLVPAINPPNVNAIPAPTNIEFRKPMITAYFQDAYKQVQIIRIFLKKRLKWVSLRFYPLRV